MASQFKNSNLGYYLYAGIVVFIGAASLFVFWYMVTGFNIGNYSQNTYIGSVYIGGLNEEEAEEKLRTRIENWLEDDSVLFEIRYQGYNYEINRDLIFFDIDQSIRNIQDGHANTLYVSLSTTAVAEILTDIDNQLWMSGLEDRFDFEAVLSEVEIAAAGMRSFASIQLNAHVNPDVQYIVPLEIGARTVPSTLHGFSIDSDALFSKLETHFPDGISINPRSQFSMLDTFPNTFTPGELSFIGSLFMEVLPYGPFTITEHRYFVDDDPSVYGIDYINIMAGRNVLVQRSRNIDFGFENNTHSTFYFEFDRDNELFTITMLGAELLNTIEVETIIHEMPYDTETTTDASLTRDGMNGRFVMVWRTIIDINDEVISRELIHYERYPAINAIVME